MAGVRDELCKYPTVVLYEKETADVKKLLAHASDDGICLDLGSNEELHKRISQEYELAKLPALLYRGGLVYADQDVQGRLEQIDEENIASTRAFLASFVLKDGLTVFIKGTIEKPYCKYTKQLIASMKNAGAEKIKDFDIFTNNDLRYYMKIINEWPTFPMVYADGKFIGGLDSYKALNNVE